MQHLNFCSNISNTDEIQNSTHDSLDHFLNLRSETETNTETNVAGVLRIGIKLNTDQVWESSFELTQVYVFTQGISTI